MVRERSSVRDVSIATPARFPALPETAQCRTALTRKKVRTASMKAPCGAEIEIDCPPTCRLRASVVAPSPVPLPINHDSAEAPANAPRICITT